MTLDKYIANHSFSMLQIMACDTPYIEKKPYKNMDTTVLLYVLAEVIVEGIYSNSIKSNFG